VAPGQTLEIQLEASDPDGDPIVYYVYGRVPLGARFEKRIGRFTWTPDADQVGMEAQLTFAASDRQVETREPVTILVTERSGNSPPSFVPVGDQVAQVGKELWLELEATDPDSDPLTFSAGSALPEGAALTKKGTFTWTPAAEDAGRRVDVVFLVSDGEDEDRLELAIVVEGEGGEGSNRPPVLDPIGHRDVQPDATLFIRVTASDPDGDPLAFAVDGAPEDHSFTQRANGEHLFEWRPGEEQSGRTYAMVFSVHDQPADPAQTLSDREEVVLSVGGEPPVAEGEGEGPAEGEGEGPAEGEGEGAPPPCEDDDYEDNDTPEQARALQPGSYAELQLCPDDEDWYEVAVPEGRGLVATITFDNAQGDLDLELRDPDGGGLLDWSDGVADLERVVIEATPAGGTLLLRVLGYEEEGGPYDLEARVVDCVDDAFEDNDDRDTATPLPLGEEHDLRVCAGDADWFSFPAEEGMSIEVLVLFTHEEGDLEAHLYAPDRPAAVGRGESFSDDEVMTVAQAPATGDYLLRVDGWLGAENTYLLLAETGPGCLPDAAEPNDGPDDPFPLDGSLPDLSACGDPDWYVIRADEGGQVLVEARTADSGLRLTLLSAEGDQTVATDEEDALGRLLTSPELAAGDYLLRVVGGRLGAIYSLELLVEPPQ